MSDIEARLADEAREPSDNERNARALAVLVKTLRELSAFDAEAKQQEQGAKTHDTHDDIPRDIDEFRRELSRRLDRLVAEAKAACPDEDAAG